MSIDPMFETLTPSRIVTCTTPNPVNHRCYLRTPRIRVVVLDSPVPVAADDLPKIAAMIVPDQRETDWTFCANSGLRQLLLDYPNISRLILIGNDLPPNPHPCIYTRPPDTDTVDVDRKKLEDELQSLVMSLHPKVCFQNGLPKIRFLTYEDDLLYRVIVATFVGPVVGEFVVEDVLMEVHDDSVDKKLRRNLRFKRMPNLIQSQVHLYPVMADDGKVVADVISLEYLKKMKNVKFQIDTTILVHSYLAPMVSGLFFIGSHLNKRIRQGFPPRALCLGVGGGALLTFLNTQMGFEVVGVEIDEAVLSAAKQFFGFNNGNSIQLIVGDAIELIQNSAMQQKKGATDDSDPDVKIDGLDAKFDVVMVDLDSNEPRYGIRAPPLEFVKKSVIQAVRLLFDDDHGVCIINVVPVDDLFYKTLVQELKDAFHSVHEIDVEDEDNVVLVATVSEPTSSMDEDAAAFLEKLMHEIPEGLLESVAEL
ncbi:uncharacterized protein LOC111921731 [Lactuca sativa]|uniref:uncharacterized protein LOC111921731 n=1 Tax=Lactuca sativa TaxID=4236 RepID=UPI000CC5B5B3|nr:uncharacterized protein LOC111921731 [Lactuca sativa]